jgi:hypothetical protein
MATATPEEMANWPAPNFVNPESRAGVVYGLTAPTLALVIVFTFARFYGKGILRQALGLDDWMMLIAAVRFFYLSTRVADSVKVFSIPVSAIAMISLKYGLALHIWDQKDEWQSTYSKV